MKQPIIINPSGERLDTLIEGNENRPLVIFVHGFGTNKDEGFDLFKDIAVALWPTKCTVRFDFSGYGASGGKQEDASCHKMKDDLQAVLEWSKQQFNQEISIIAHSMGSLVTSLLAPEHIQRAIFTGLPQPSTTRTIQNIQRRIISRPGGIVNELGVSIYPRTDGQIQKIGSQFWQSLRRFNTIDVITAFAKKTNLTLIKPLHDEVADPKVAEPYKHITSATYIEIPGDHNFTKPEDRAKLQKIITELI